MTSAAEQEQLSRVGLGGDPSYSKRSRTVFEVGSASIEAWRSSMCTSPRSARWSESSNIERSKVSLMRPNAGNKPRAVGTSA